MEPREMAEAIAAKLDEKKAQEVCIIDISSKAAFADYLVLATGGNERQLAALVEHVEDIMEPASVFPKGVEGKKTSGWILMDYGDVVVNIMTEDMRVRYNMERIWGDCELIQIN